MVNTLTLVVLIWKSLQFPYKLNFYIKELRNEDASAPPPTPSSCNEEDALCSHWEGDTEDLSQRAPSYHMLITFLFN